MVHRKVLVLTYEKAHGSRHVDRRTDRVTGVCPKILEEIFLHIGTAMLVGPPGRHPNQLPHNCWDLLICLGILCGVSSSICGILTIACIVVYLIFRVILLIFHVDPPPL